MKKIILVLMIFSTYIFASGQIYKVVMSEAIPKGYDKDVYKKAIVLMTEGRLYLQKKYRKKVTFEYTDKLAKTKKDVKALLDKYKGRFYVVLDIKRKASKKNLEKVLYTLVIFDTHTKKFKKIKTKAIIRDKKIVQISQGDLKSTGKKIAKLLKKK